MPPRGRFVWNEKAGRFRAPNGKFLKSRQVRSMIDRTLAAHTRAVAQLTEQLRQRAVSLAEWERRMRAEIKGIHLYSAMAAKGGRSQMTAADFGRIGASLRFNYTRLRRFADEIMSGKQRLDGTAVRRTRLYAQSGRGVFEGTRRALMRSMGFDQWRNVLRSVEHCIGEGSCTEATALGWQPIGQGFSLPGGRLCVTNCACELSYRNSRTGDVSR